MIVKDIIITACQMIDKKEVIKAFELNNIEYANKNTKEDIDNLLTSVNLANNLLASEYYALKKATSIKPDFGMVYFEDLTSEKLNKIISVKDKYGNNVVYKIFNDHIKTVSDEVIVTYSYLPRPVSLTDAILDYKLFISERIFAYAVLMEYCFMKALYDDALVWENRFKNSLLIGLTKKRGVNIPKRRWA